MNTFSQSMIAIGLYGILYGGINVLQEIRLIDPIVLIYGGIVNVLFGLLIIIIIKLSQ